jgi:2-isopropylmalate synthase
MSGIYLYDTTLRDGAQHEGISFSVEDKLKITRKLDELGVPYIEGGWPGSNPKDIDYFRQVRALPLANATIVAFGSTRRAGVTAEQDPILQALVASEASVVTLVGKSWDLHVTRILETDLEENLAMIADSVAFLRARGRRVFFDAEHLFDGFKADPRYATRCVLAAAEAGAETVILCDTNGGTLPHEVTQVVSQLRKEVGVPLGIHAHNDSDVAVANTLAAVEAGVEQVQGTVNGYGERCGNANLLSVAANLTLKLGIPCLTADQMGLLTKVHRYIGEVVNLPTNGSQPFVGSSAFSHKGGLHGSAVAKVEDSYQHIKPVLVGNTTRMLISELAGRGNITYKLRELGLEAALPLGRAAALAQEIKDRESLGYQYEGAEASFELLVRRTVDGYAAPFKLVEYTATVRRQRPPSGGLEEEMAAEATVKVRVGQEVRHTVAMGNGPVNALDAALRRALLQDYPRLAAVRLVDFKVRVVDQGSATAAIVRVLIESTDGAHTWQTVGASTDIIAASWEAVADSLEYWLLKYEKPANGL